MATLVDLERDGIIVHFDVLESNEQPFRHIFLLEKAVKWIREAEGADGSLVRSDSSSLEELYALVHTFCSGGVLIYGTQFKALRCRGQGVWELKTYDIRMFGWFVARDKFVISNFGWTDRVKRNNLYQGYIDEAVRQRNLLSLNEPKHIGGDNPYDVVSDFAYS